MLIHIFVSGRVQGVGYRAWAQRTAQSLNVSGWVRNRINGQVEILAEGDDKNIDSFLTLCRKGPFFSSVRDISPVADSKAVVMPIQPGIFSIEATV